MISIIQKYFKKAQEASEKRCFADGFGWAMAEVLLNNLTIEEVYDKVEFPFEEAKFDAGAREALRLLADQDSLAQEHAELKPHYAALEAENALLKKDRALHFDALCESANRIRQLNAANTGLRATLTKLLTEIPDAWEPGDSIEVAWEGFDLNSEWPELWVAQDEDGDWYEYSKEPYINTVNNTWDTKLDSGADYQCIIGSNVRNKNPNWKDTKQRIR